MKDSRVIGFWCTMLVVKNTTNGKGMCQVGRPDTITNGLSGSRISFL